MTYMGRIVFENAVANILFTFQSTVSAETGTQINIQAVAPREMVVTCGGIRRGILTKALQRNAPTRFVKSRQARTIVIGDTCAILSKIAHRGIRGRNVEADGSGAILVRVPGFACTLVRHVTVAIAGTDTTQIDSQI